MNKNNKPSILIVDDERNTRDIMARFLRTTYNVTLAEDGIRGINILKKNDFDLVLTDMRMPGADGMEVLKATLEKPDVPLCIIMTAYGSVELAVEAVKAGAADFIVKPLNFDHLEVMLERALESRRLKTENRQLKTKLNQGTGEQKIIANSKAMLDVMATVRQIAPSRSTILITGESGTGKEVIAQAIHTLSGRTGRMVAVHCGALPTNLLESELFGHEKGSFTGAVERKQGRFELADNGTLFLDEIGEIEPQVQVKLLRALETRSFERIGGVETVYSDCRLLSATNRDLKQLVAEGSFREDLFYRLDVVSIHLPPLRERQADIPMLIKYFLEQFALENNRKIEGMSEDALAMLCAYEWPGNIRELRNCIERMTVLSSKTNFDVDDIPPMIRDKSGVNLAPALVSNQLLSLDKNEKLLITLALKECNGNRTKAAAKLGISRRPLHRKINNYNLN
jgi:DNA-binding NtrC family response regulator